MPLASSGIHIQEWWCTIFTTGEKEENHTSTKMTRLSKSNDDVRKGAWAAEEDEKLRKYVETYGTGHWRSVGKKAGNDLTKKTKKIKTARGFIHNLVVFRVSPLGDLIGLPFR